jgi:predicted peptidase
MLFFHGINERGSDLNQVWKYGPLYYARYDSLGVKVDYIAAAPQLPAGQNWTAKHVKDILNFMITNYPQVDKDQVWIVGVSLGGGAIWKAMQDTTINKRIAAFVPICAVKGDYSKAKIIAESNVPGWAFFSLGDGITSPYSQQMVDSVNKAAKKALILTQPYDGTSHPIWAKVFKDTRFLPWLKFQRRPGETEPVIKQEVVNGNTLRIYTPSRTYDVPLKPTSSNWRNLDFRRLALEAADF